MFNKYFIVPILLFVCSVGFCQSDYGAIDQRSKTVPDSITDYKLITKYLTDGLTGEREKVRAIYIWIAHNIKYDLAQLNSEKRYNSNQEIINEAMATKKGVCQHYSELFCAMGASIGLKTYLIKGYTRDALGEIADLSHA
ncbi:transglutaminase-like domain-containing protein [Aquimarina agarivorans]|uniref:transglutaminase-like domain-containing protein n=1 Tax=Aquimarina agarivorans TaxID=980584 RepID=UPI0002F70F05|nr:transglutaminase-like domain-containing protein [Aquimarina agarivorans]